MKTWRCFHCDEVFDRAADAQAHFGRTELQNPACTIDIKAYREMEELVRRSNDEDSDLHREMARMEYDHRLSLIRAEEDGYARGLRDGQAYNFYKEEK